MKTNSAGALLFAIITAFVLTLVASTLVVLTTNQYKIIDSEVDRIRAFYRAQAGMEYAIWYAYTNGISPTPLSITIDEVLVNITFGLGAPISANSITISTTY